MLILVNGLPLFAKQIVNDMNSFQSEHKFVFCNTYYSRLDKLKFFLLLPFAGMCISVNGVTDNSSALNWVIRLRKKLMLLWSGTDVLLALERQQKQTISRKYIDYACNATDSNLLSEELLQLNIQHVHTFFKWLPVESLKQQSYASIQVLSYVAKGKEDFYGWQTIRQAAIDFPSLKFILVGTDGASLQLPENVKCLGWIDKEKLTTLYQQCAIFLRLPQHDGFSLSVLEALAHGAEVIWTTPMPAYVMHWKEGELFNPLLEKAIANINSRQLHSDLERQLAIGKQFNKETVLHGFLQTINAVE